MIKVSSEVDCLHWLGYNKRTRGQQENKENKELASI